MALALACLAPGSTSAQLRDPTLTWRTVRTDHFVIHYHDPLAHLARRVARVAERAHATLSTILGFEPGDRIEVVITDDADFANGSATAVPYDTIRLFAQAPEDLAPLADYDDWFTVLITHEHTHVLQLDQASGLPSIINAILGKVWMPNHVLPRWFIEGLAVWQESEHTSGGRLRSTVWDMYLRADALEDRFWDLDQVSTIADRWPHGNAAYLYGSYFVRYVAQRFGREALASMIRDYGSSILPYGINRMAERATGESFVDDLWREFLDERRAHYGAQRRAIEAIGVHEGERLTRHGEVARSPRFMSDGRLLYLRADERSRSEVVVADAATGARREVLARTTAGGEGAVSRDGRTLVYSRADAHRDIYFFTDLFRRDLETGHEERLTHGLRAREPDISSDDRRVVFTTSRAGTTHLRIADLADVEGTLRDLVPPTFSGQFYTPRFSPDTRTVAVSRWLPGGYRDIVLVDVATGAVQEITHDRAQESGPVFSPDGRHLYFTSDRTGVANVYSYHLASGTLRQVTNVVNGAYQPAISPDGARMIYVGYTSYGFDLFSMAITPDGFRAAPRYVDRRPEPVPTDDDDVFALHSDDYDPLPTLYPRSWMLDATPDAFGIALGASVSGEDVLAFHSWSARVGVGLVRGNVGVDASYTYAGWPLRVAARFFRRESRGGGLAINGEPVPWIQDAIGGDVSLGYTFPHTFRFSSVGLAYSVSHTRTLEPVPIDILPDRDLPRFPETGLFSGLRLSWSYSDVERYGYDISPSNGRTIAISISAADPLLGATYRLLTFTWGISQYIPMPWGEHHVLALRYAGGISGGDAGRRGVFGVGGYPQVALIDGPGLPNVLGGQALRGYAPSDRVGTQFHLAQAEFRFPIVRLNRGVSTLPIYVNRLWATVLCDWGDAFFGEPNLELFRWGIGAELHLDFTLFYVLSWSLRVGYARGLSDGGVDQFYAHLGVPF